MGVLDVLAPVRCLACRRRSAPPWCAACRADAVAAQDGCPFCADPWPAHACPASGTPIAATVAVWSYDGPVQAVIATAKARGAWAGWSRLAEPLACAVDAAGWSADVVTWIPPSRQVARRRGIDHAGVLARGVAGCLGWPLAPLLVAPGPRADQVVGPRGRARTLPAGTFTAAAAPRSVLLVDDVMTTGATARAGALALGGSGADRVLVAVLARSGRPPSR